MCSLVNTVITFKKSRAVSHFLKCLRMFENILNGLIESSFLRGRTLQQAIYFMLDDTICVKVKFDGGEESLPD